MVGLAGLAGVVQWLQLLWKLAPLERNYGLVTGQ